MISHGKDLKIFSGNSNRALAEAICKELRLPLGDLECGHFSDGECFVSIYETVRGSDVFVIQSTCSPVNDSLMELLVMIDAFKRASAGRITAVIPYFGYARQDRKAKPRDPISAKLVANMLTTAGADRVLTMDLHAAQIQGFFDIPVDNLLGSPLFVDYFKARFGDDADNTMVVSPDVGSVARARSFAQKLGMSMAIVDKRRPKPNSSEVSSIIGDVQGKRVILLDDMVDTAGSLCGAAKALVEVGGEIFARGHNAKGGLWRVGIDKPIEGNVIPGAQLQVRIGISNRGLATSGNYRKFYTDSLGRKIVHTFDARTGAPVISNLLSATVVARTAAQADAYGTLCMVMGLNESIRFLESRPDLEAYLVWSDDRGNYRTYMTPGMESLVLQ